MHSVSAEALSVCAHYEISPGGPPWWGLGAVPACSSSTSVLGLRTTIRTGFQQQQLGSAYKMNIQLIC
jgi:hypothetical protein